MKKLILYITYLYFIFHINFIKVTEGFFFSIRYKLYVENSYLEFHAFIQQAQTCMTLNLCKDTVSESAEKNK